jgi:hypothetical protein
MAFPQMNVLLGNTRTCHRQETHSRLFDCDWTQKSPASRFNLASPRPTFMEDKCHLQLR